MDLKQFFILDFEGHIDDENVQKVLEKNQKHQIKWLGSYVSGE